MINFSINRNKIAIDIFHTLEKKYILLNVVNR